MTRMSDRHYEFLLALHELVEAMLCAETGVSQAAVDAFDKAYEAKRPPADKDSEPGDDPANIRLLLDPRRARPCPDCRSPVAHRC